MTLFFEHKIEQAVDLLQKYEPDTGYALAFSGGKDSQLIYHLARAAGVKFQAFQSLTGVDPPEVLKFVRQYYPDVKMVRNKLLFFDLCKKKAMVPSFNMRFCCSNLKEHNPYQKTHKVTILGIRREESSRRAKRNYYEKSKKAKNHYLLCPILEFDEDEVWEYLDAHALAHCSLYDEDGVSRIGCVVVCPYLTMRMRLWEARRYPHIFRYYKKTAFELFHDNLKRRVHKNGLYRSWEDYWDCVFFGVNFGNPERVDKNKEIAKQLGYLEFL